MGRVAHTPDQQDQYPSTQLSLGMEEPFALVHKRQAPQHLHAPTRIKKPTKDELK